MAMRRSGCCWRRMKPRPRRWPPSWMRPIASGGRWRRACSRRPRRGWPGPRCSRPTMPAGIPAWWGWRRGGWRGGMAGRPRSGSRRPTGRCACRCGGGRVSTSGGCWMPAPRTWTAMAAMRAPAAARCAPGAGRPSWPISARRWRRKPGMSPRPGGWWTGCWGWARCTRGWPRDCNASSRRGRAIRRVAGCWRKASSPRGGR